MKTGRNLLNRNFKKFMTAGAVVLLGLVLVFITKRQIDQETPLSSNGHVEALPAKHTQPQSTKEIRQSKAPVSVANAETGTAAQPEAGSLPELRSAYLDIQPESIVEWNFVAGSGESRIHAIVDAEKDLFIEARKTSSGQWEIERASLLGEFLIHSESVPFDDWKAKGYLDSGFIQLMESNEALARVRMHADSLIEDEVARTFLEAALPDNSYDRNSLVYPVATPNDPNYAGSWTLAKLELEPVWEEYGFSPEAALGRRPVIAVVDDGVSASDPDLHLWTNVDEIAGNGVDDDGNGYIDDVTGYNFYRDNNDMSFVGGHGAEVARVSSSLTNNGTGTASPASSAAVMRVIAYESSSGSDYDAVDAILYAVKNQADVVNCSFISQSVFAFLSVLGPLESYDTILVAAAGNNGSDLGTSPWYPVCLPSAYVIGVGASDSSDSLSNSNYSSEHVDVFAPGSFTSFTTPLVSSSAALLKALKPSASSSEIKSAIISGVDPVPALSGLSVSGGRLNVKGAVEALLGIDLDGQAPDPTSPAAPSISVSNITQTAASLSWQSGETVDGYEVEYKVGTGSFLPLEPSSVFTGTTTGSVVEGLSPSTSYTFRIRALSGALSSDWTESDSVTTLQPAPTVPPVPVLSVDNVGIGSVDLSWTISEPVNSFLVQYSEEGGLWTDASPYYPGTWTSVSLSLKEGTTYTFRIRSERGLNSAWVESGALTTLNSEPVAPAAPSIAIDSVGIGTVNLSWVSNEAVDTFEIEFQSAGTSLWQAAGNFSGSEIQTAVDSLDEGATYIFRIRSQRAGVFSDWTESNPVTTLEPEPVAPSTPVLYVDSVGIGSVALSWTTNEPVNSFLLQYSEAGGPWTDTSPYYPGTQTSVSLSLNMGTTYIFRIRSELGLLSDWTESDPVTTLKPSPVAPVAPTISVNSVGIGSVTLSWGSGEQVDVFELELQESGSNLWSTAGTFSGVETQTTVDSLGEEVSYLFRIRSMRADLYSEWTQSIPATTQKPEPHPEPDPGFYDVTYYGANGNDAIEDTEAIDQAIAAAAANGGGEVFFPAGTYIVSPPGTAVIDFYSKSGGVWNLIHEQIESPARFNSWHFGESAPVYADGNTGDYWVDLRGGTVHQKKTTGWVLDAYLVDKLGTGWTSGHYDPNPASGGEGDVYMKFHVEMDNINGAVFELTQEHNNITFRGEGSDVSILSFLTWSGQDPMGYEVNVESEAILSSVIPQGPSGRYKRGSLFVMNQVGFVEFDNIHWDGLQMKGNTIANGKHGWYYPFHDLEEWDISNKCIVFTFGGTRPMHNITVRNCSVNGWRGEVLYKGGDNVADIRIENCDIFESNASAVSISGNVVMEDCRLWDVYNGVENYALDGLFTEVRRCSISNNKGDWGIVYLGTDKAYLKVEDCDLSNAGLGGIFLSDFADNVEIRRNTFSDSPWGVYFIYLNQYNLPGHYNNILIEDNTFLAKNRDMDYAVLSYLEGMEAKNWVIQNNIARGENGFRIRNFMGDKHTGPRAEMHDVLVAGNAIENARLFSGYGLVPVCQNNELTGDNVYVELNLTDSVDQVLQFQPLHPFYKVGYVHFSDHQIAIDGMWRYPTGHKFSIRRNDYAQKKGAAVLPGSWNNLERGYALYDDASITLEMGADGLFHLVEYVAPTDQGDFVISSGTEIAARGRAMIALKPSVPTTYASFSGIPFNAPVVVSVNENVRFAQNASILTPTGSTYDPESDSVTMIVLENGILQIDGAVDPLPNPDPEPDPDPDPEPDPEPDPVDVTAPGLSVDSIEPGSVSISWNSTTLVDGFIVQYSTAGGFYAALEPVSVFSSDSTGIRIENLIEGESYEFRVRTYTGTTYSDWTLSGSIVIPESPVIDPDPQPDPEPDPDPEPQPDPEPDPINLTVPQVNIYSFGPGYVELEWDSPDTVDGYEVEYSHIADAYLPLEPDGLFAADSTGVRVDGLAEGESYGFRVRSFVGDVVSDWALSGTIMIPQASSGTLPEVPSLTVINVGVDFIELGWRVNGEVDSFELQTSEAGGSFIVAEPETLFSGDTTGVQMDSLLSGTAYAFRIRAIKQDMVSDWRYTTLVVTDVVQPDSPVAPEWEAVIEDSGSIFLEWFSEESVDTFELQYSQDASPFIDLALIDGAELSVEVTDLAMGSEYQFRIRSVRGELSSAWVTSDLVLIPDTAWIPGTSVPEPVHYWSFDVLPASVKSSEGSSPLPLDLVEVQSVPGIGSSGAGIEFSDGHRGVRIPDAVTLNEGVRKAMTLSIWVRISREANKDTAVIYEQGGYWRGLNVLVDRCWLQVNGWNLPGNESNWSGTTLYGGKLKHSVWNHVAVVLEGGESVTSDALKLYLNGELVASGAGSQLWIQGDDNGLGQVQQSTLYRGRQVLALDPFKGSMDDLAIWNVALSGAQLEELILASFPEN